MAVKTTDSKIKASHTAGGCVVGLASVPYSPAGYFVAPGGEPIFSRASAARMAAQMNALMVANGATRGSLERARGVARD